MQRIGIFTPVVLNGDAVSNDVIGMQQSLAALGYESRLFALHWGTDRIEIHHLDGLESWVSDPSAVAIYHYSIGWDVGFDLLQRLRCRKIVKYHNVTPPEFFEGVNPDYVNVCRHGREQLNAVGSAAYDLYLSDSAYNMEELVVAGASRAASLVVPPFHQIDRLYSIEADLQVLDQYDDGQTNILMVGRIAPNKGHLALIEAFGIYHHEYNPQSRLIIVGKDDPSLKAYTDKLHALVGQLRLQNAVVFTGGVSDEALKAFYLLSNVFMITSEHEGFCVPLVEAMSMKMPIVAYSSSAIPGTVGKAGLVWEEREPLLLAESIHTIVQDESLAAGLGLMGWRRYCEHFDNEVIRDQFLQSLRPFLN